MATTINTYSVGLTLDASDYINKAEMSRSETAKLARDIEKARTPAENFSRDQDRLTRALEKGAISEATYNRLLAAKKEKLDQATAALQKNSAAQQLNNSGSQGLGQQLSFLKSKYLLVAAAAAAAVAAVMKVVDVFRQAAVEIDSTAKAAAKLGVTFNELQGLRFAAGEIAGASADQVDNAIKQMQIRMSQAISGDGAAAAAFERLGLDAAQMMAAGPMESIRMISAAMQNVASEAERLELAKAMFGSAGPEILGLLTASSESLQESIAFQERWNSLSEAQVMAVEAANDAWGRVYTVVEGAINYIAAEFAPLMQIIAEDVLGLAENATGFKDTIKVVVDTFAFFYNSYKEKIQMLWAPVRAITALLKGDIMGAKEVADDFVNKFFDIDLARHTDQLNARRIELEEQAKKREEERAKKNLEREQEAKDKLAQKEEEAAQRAHELKLQQQREILEKLEREDMDRMGRAHKAAMDYFEKERQRQMRMRTDVARGPGAGIEADSQEAARFMASEINKAIGAAAAPVMPTPGEKEIIEETKKQYEALLEQQKLEAEQNATLRAILDEQRNNGFVRAR